MKKIDDKTKHVSAVLPAELHRRLLMQAAKETRELQRRTTPSDIIRCAIEDYLDQYEVAEFSPYPTEKES